MKLAMLLWIAVFAVSNDVIAVRIALLMFVFCAVVELSDAIRSLKDK